MQTDKKRIEYIDLAKGVCILLVVFAHIHPDLTRYSWGVFFDSFRMPLYFFLSGIFFKRYSGIQEFAIKKVNNLIIPLLFFYAFAYLYDAVSWVFIFCRNPIRRLTNDTRGGLFGKSFARE